VSVGVQVLTVGGGTRSVGLRSVRDCWMNVGGYIQGQSAAGSITRSVRTFIRVQGQVTRCGLFSRCNDALR